MRTSLAWVAAELPNPKAPTSIIHPLATCSVYLAWQPQPLEQYSLNVITH